ATLDNTLGHRYGYDDPGRLAHEISVPNDKGRDFTYDGLGRLTSVVFKAKGSFAPSCTVTEEDGWSCSGFFWTTDSTRSYTYDGANNRTDQTGTYSTGNRIV